MSDERFRRHDEWQEEIMKTIRPHLTNGHIPDVRIYVNSVLFSIDFKTTRNVEKNSHDVYFELTRNGERVAIVYNNRPYERAEDGETLASFIENLKWEGPIPPSVKSRSGDPYYKISGGVPLIQFLKEIKP